MIVLKQPKTKCSVRDVEVPSTVLESLLILKNLQEQMKIELGTEWYIDHDLVICQANGRPLMTEHLNKRFKKILTEMNDPQINSEEIVFHGLRHTNASTKLAISNDDFNSVKHAGGWADLNMLTKRYGSHSFDSNRESLAEKMNEFLMNTQKSNNQQPSKTEQVYKLLEEADPELLIQILKSFQSVNK